MVLPKRLAAATGQVWDDVHNLGFWALQAAKPPMLGRLQRCHPMTVPGIAAHSGGASLPERGRAAATTTRMQASRGTNA